MTCRWLLIAVSVVCAGLAQAKDCPAWSSTQARQEMAALAARVDGWNHAYRVDGQSPVDDAVYDLCARPLHRPVWINCQTPMRWRSGCARVRQVTCGRNRKLMGSR